MTKHMSLSEFELLAYPEITPQQAAEELMRRRRDGYSQPDCSPSRAAFLRCQRFTAREWLEVAAIVAFGVFLFALPVVAISAAFWIAR